MGYIITFGEKYWPANRIPFLIDSDDFPVSTPDRKDVEDAIGVWNKTEKVRLVPRNDEHDYVIFKRKKSTCNSNVGRKGGEQAILCNIGEGFKLGNIIHEIGHTLGLFHEHQRPDRDKYVSIDSSVKDDDNYYIETNGRAINNYDCDSIMHYPKIKDKITNLSSECEKMGQRIKPSMGDIAAASWLLSYPWAPFCGIGIKPNGDGYWLVEGKGGVLYYGNTLFYGSMGGQQLNQPICGMVVTQSGKGYWLVAEDGGVFTFG
ncbi:M12 family metallopeptidase, partial [Bacillus tropicus]|uniref:M12 family metallopeptidase n=1 Tax=Bacillus tropicus TaxID=2026188 RepID=UPI0021D137CE